MKYFKPLALVFASLMLLTAPTVSHAQMSRKDQAKVRFTKGIALYQAGKYLQAIKEMKAAYLLIPKPIVLFYIAEVYKDADLKDEAISYYKRYLNEERINDKTGNRKKAEDAIKKLGGSLTATKDPGVPVVSPGKDPVKPVTPGPVTKPKRPRRKYKKGELIHTPLEEAQPKRPAKLEVELPEDIKRAWLYVYYRAVGQETYAKAKMKVDKNDIYYFILPCKAMKGPLLQYYIEAVGVSGRKIAGSATASSPFIVDINKKNPLQPGGNMSCDGLGTNGTSAPITNGGTKTPDTPQPKGRKRSYHLMIGSSVAAVALITASIVFGKMSMDKATALEDSQMALVDPLKYPPTRRYENGIVAFSGEIADYEKTGKAYETTMFLTAGLSVLAVGAAVYFALDYLEILPTSVSLDAKLGYRGKKESKVTVAPIIGDDFYGIGGSIRF